MTSSVHLDQLSRRRLLSNIATAGCGIACAGIGSCGVFSLMKRNTLRTRRTPDDGLSLSEYLRNEASSIEVFPYSFFAFSGMRFQAELTFTRYLKFYRFKEKVLASSKKEIDDCVCQIESFSTREKALTLFATFIYDCVYQSAPHRHAHYQNRYRKWRKHVKSLTSTSKELKQPIPSSSLVENFLQHRFGVELKQPIHTSSRDFEKFERRSYVPGKRSYYPNYYPVLGFYPEARKFLIIGEPSPDRDVDSECCERWQALRNEYESSQETVFSSTPLRTAVAPSEDDYESKLSRLRESPLRFPASDRPPRARSSIFSSDMPRCPGKDLFSDANEKGRWIEWFKNIEECVAIINTELGLKIPAEKWVSDYYPDADLFLKKIAEFENDTSIPLEKFELLTGLREYWLSMQISFDYDFYQIYWLSSAAPSSKASPFFDVAETKGATLGRFVSLFRLW